MRAYIMIAGRPMESWNSERFWDPSGQRNGDFRKRVAQIRTFRPDPEKSSFWAPFSELFGPQIGHDADFGGLWADFRSKMQGPKNSRFSDARFLPIMVENGPPKWKRSGYILGHFLDFLARSAPEASRPPQNHEIEYFCLRIMCTFCHTNECTDMRNQYMYHGIQQQYGAQAHVRKEVSTNHHGSMGTSIRRFFFRFIRFKLY